MRQFKGEESIVQILTDYHQLEVLAQTPGRRTLRALNASDQKVILKELAVHDLANWKGLELFERELKTLLRLQHPRLPRLLDHFQHSTEGQTTLYLVLEQMPGQNLAHKLAAGWRPDEAEVKNIAHQLLSILRDLHGLKPPVLHRDIQPAHILLDDSGQISLVDLGAMQEGLRSKPGSTLVGRFGYMAPEQGLGQAFAANDLYGVGSTLLHLLTGVSPAEIPTKDLKLMYEAHLHCSLPLRHWLSRLLAPWPDQRYISAAAALEALEQLERFPPWPELPPPLHGSRLLLQQQAHQLDVKMAAGRWSASAWICLGIGLMMSWVTSFMGLVAYVAPATPDSAWLLPWMLGTFGGLALFFFGVTAWLVGQSTQLRLTRSTLWLEKYSWGFCWQRRQFPLSQIQCVSIERLPDDAHGARAIAIQHGQGRCFVGQTLSPVEQAWLVPVLRDAMASQLKPEQLTRLQTQAAEEAMTNDDR